MYSDIFSVDLWCCQLFWCFIENARNVTQFHEKISNLGILHILRYFAWFHDIDIFQCCCDVLGDNIMWCRCCASAHCSILVLGSSVSLPWVEKPWKFHVFKGWMTRSMARGLFCICHHGVRWFLSTAGWTVRNSSDMSENERNLNGHAQMAPKPTILRNAPGQLHGLFAIHISSAMV